MCLWEKIFSKSNEHDSWLQSEFNILCFKLNKFDMNHKILLIKHVLTFLETSLKSICCIILWNTFLILFRLNQIVNKYFELIIVFQFAKMMFEKLLLDKEMEWCQKSEIFTKNVFKIVTILNNLVLFCRF